MPVTQFIWISIKNMFQYDSMCMYIDCLISLRCLSFCIQWDLKISCNMYVIIYGWSMKWTKSAAHACLWVWNFRIDCFLIYVNVHHDFMWHCLLSVDHQIWFYLAIYEWLIRLQWLIFAINFFFIIKQRAKNIKDLVCNEKYSE